MSSTAPLVSTMNDPEVLLTPSSSRTSPGTYSPPPVHPGRQTPSMKSYRPPPLSNAPEPKMAPPKVAATLAPPQRAASPPSTIKSTKNSIFPWKNSSRSQLNDENDAFAVPPTEEELRETFEEEEIQRFLNVFHSNIDEVTLPTALDSSHLPTGEQGSSGQKIVIIAPEDVDKVTAAGAAPASAAVEAIPPSVAAQLNEVIEKKRAEKAANRTTGRDDDDDDSSTVADEDGEETDAETEVDEEVWVERHDGVVAGVGVPGEKDKKELGLRHVDTLGSTTGVGVDGKAEREPRVYSPEDDLPSRQNPKKIAIQRERIWGSEKAADFISQFLPQGRAMEARNRRGGKHEKFSLTRLRVAGQRTYLATYPLYTPLMLSLWDTARWIDWNHSFKLCAVWWTLWWFNMLLPGLLWYFVYQLIKHRVMPYPTLQQLEDRREAALEAENITRAISGEAPKKGAKDPNAPPAWQPAENMTSLGLGTGIAANTLIVGSSSTPVKEKVKSGVRIAVGAMTGRWGKMGKDSVDEETKMDYIEENEELVDKTRRRQAGDWRRMALIALEELADAHERMRNLMLWRRKDSTRSYTIVLAVLAFVMMVTPVEYLAKGTYAGLGFVYWFLIPTLCAMTRRQRALIPPPLFDVPTDAEYAMEIIARRLQLGQSVTPDKKSNANKEYIRGSNVALAAARSSASLHNGVTGLDAQVAERLEMDGVQTMANGDAGVSANGGQEPFSGPDVTDVSPAIPGSMPGGVAVTRQGTLPIQIQTFSAHHNHLPGILTLTDTNIEFVPLSFFNKLRKHSEDPKVSISLDCIRGIKKASSRTKSLIVRYIEPIATSPTTGGRLSKRQQSLGGASGSGVDYQTVDDPEGDADAIVMAEREVKFKWVGHRDEVFARLVASKRSAWVPV